MIEALTMPWIEGVGDEVTLFFMSISVLIIGIIAWLSTNIGDQPLVRTVLILERRARTRETFDSPQALSPSGPSTQATQTDPGSDEEVEEFVVEAAYETEQCDASTTTGESNDEPIIVEADEDPAFEPQVSDCSDVDCFDCYSDLRSGDGNVSSDSDAGHNSCLLRRRRLGFFRNHQATLLPTPPASVIETGDTYATSTVPGTGHIRIRLKYLNDDQKLVEGSLDEQLGDFKRRNFSSELSAQKMIRLIFNGHVLLRDEDTLGSYGLFDNCVVHCLVHQHRNVTDPQIVVDSLSPNELPVNREWHLGSILFVLLTILLGLAWYCRYHYSYLFNASSTVALVGLTGILTISLVGLYLPDQDVLR